MPLRDPERRGVPRLPIFFSLGQVASCLGLTEKILRESYAWLDGHDRGIYHPRFIRAVNVRPDAKSGTEDDEDWRVHEAEFTRWLRYHDLYVYDPNDIPEVTELTKRERALHAARRGQPWGDPPPVLVAPEDINAEVPDDDLLALP